MYTFILGTVVWALALLVYTVFGLPLSLPVVVFLAVVSYATAEWD